MVIGGLDSPPNNVGVCACVISRIGTFRSGRLPCTWILREPGIGRVTASESSCAARTRSEGKAFIGIRPSGIHARHGGRAEHPHRIEATAPTHGAAPCGEAPYTGA